MNSIVKRTTLTVRSLERPLEFGRGVPGQSVCEDDEIIRSGAGLAAGRARDRKRPVTCCFEIDERRGG